MKATKNTSFGEGAVTHVLVGDPTAGYGIFIDNMLSTMPNILQP